MQDKTTTYEEVVRYIAGEVMSTLEVNDPIDHAITIILTELGEDVMQQCREIDN